MATFTTNAGKNGNMLLAFQFPTAGIEGFGTVPIANTVYAFNATDFEPDLIVVYEVGMTFSGTTPTGGTFTTLTIALTSFSPSDHLGTLTGITRANNFIEIDDINAYRVLDGNDTLNGNTLGDDLTGGFGGSDIFNGAGGNDRFYVAGLGSAPTHQFNGAAGSVDEIIVKANIYTGDTALNLKSSSFASIDKISLDAGVSIALNASQFGGLSAAATINGGAGSNVTVDKDIAGTLDLSALVLTGATLTVNGSAGADVILGSTGADTIFGFDGADTLGGGAGLDTLIGGAAADVLTGGADGDFFDFDDILHIGKAVGTRDKITDFEKGLDRIDLSTIDANGAKGGDKAFKFIKKADFTEKAGQLHFVKVNKAGTAADVTRVEGDTNGNGKADFKLELAGLFKLTAEDFVL